ncbi:hypothetical protein [Brevundimonas sp.]|uniref:hypothetical protein n=1 Tax=Brevundimonas sp. TaxID=1871086 RepID=UPI0028A12312|nr:hypothetical protein [Brevundimonas sp.]
MSSYAIMRGEKRVGTVASFAGNPKATRWVGYASNERRESFPSMSAAVAWVRACDLGDQSRPNPPLTDHAETG